MKQNNLSAGQCTADVDRRGCEPLSTELSSVMLFCCAPWYKVRAQHSSQGLQQVVVAGLSWWNPVNTSCIGDNNPSGINSRYTHKGKNTKALPAKLHQGYRRGQMCRSRSSQPGDSRRGAVFPIMAELGVHQEENTERAGRKRSASQFPES